MSSIPYAAFAAIREETLAKVTRVTTSEKLVYECNHLKVKIRVLRPVQQVLSIVTCRSQTHRKVITCDWMPNLLLIEKLKNNYIQASYMN